MDFYKNNGFGDQFGKQRAHHILQGLRAAGLLARETNLGALAAKGAPARAVRNLGRLMDRLERGRLMRASMGRHCRGGRVSEHRQRGCETGG
ncbi:hypothetical protein [Streptomyces sp. HD]|uniref:hypothetical protein n=1 Tax=Streptomyces sp. HD TaxID=3020892 RepID=UPI00232FAE0A|nr:hypothetical protein [Streptomyces sp. HD]MDC0766727.1 hypothetical protein [Streptomyces sp. HD]